MPGASGRAFGIISVAALILWSTGCDYIKKFTQGGADLTVASGKLHDGDLPGAAAEYEKVAADHPDSVDAAVGLADTKLLAQ